MTKTEIAFLGGTLGRLQEEWLQQFRLKGGTTNVNPPCP